MLEKSTDLADLRKHNALNIILLSFSIIENEFFRPSFNFVLMDILLVLPMDVSLAVVVFVHVFVKLHGNKKNNANNAFSKQFLKLLCIFLENFLKVTILH